MLELYLQNLGIIEGFMVLVWLLSILIKKASIVDTFWGIGFVLVASSSFLLGSALVERKLLLLSLAAIWGLRITLHIGKRNYGKPEDYRYQAMREKHGPSFPLKSLYTVFLFQGLLLSVISLPLQFGQLKQSPNHLTTLDLLGAAVCLFGILFEAVADRQLEAFKRDPTTKGQVMNRGLWRYSRHPNYFGESVVWLGLAISACSVSYGFISLISPVMITLLLLFFSGVPLLEQRLVKTRAGYREYMLRTSSFFPLPPKQLSSAKST